jgi:hypothetical protein
MGMYQNFVLFGGPEDGKSVRVRLGTTVFLVDADQNGRYERRQLPDAGPFLRNEYHWVPNV